jgi:SAM-dependent methyltransferase
MSTDPTHRFSDRVQNYVRYRPTYPGAVLDSLAALTGFDASVIVADIGSGTGISTALFLKNGNRVYAVEPNEAMREAAERHLGAYREFQSVNGTAEATTLPDAAVDLVVAGQAFHWFHQERAKAEFRRILRPEGWVALFWNDRKTDTTLFLRAYEELLLTYGTDYREINHRNISDPAQNQFRVFFRDGLFTTVTHPNSQEFDFDGLRGRLLSSSYAPAETHPDHLPMLAALKAIFDRYQEGGKVVFEYTTELFVGRV